MKGVRSAGLGLGVIEAGGSRGCCSESGEGVVGGYPPRRTETRPRPRREGRRTDREPSALISSSSCCRETNSASMPTGVPGLGRSEGKASVRRRFGSSSKLCSFH